MIFSLVYNSNFHTVYSLIARVNVHYDVILNLTKRVFGKWENWALVGWGYRGVQNRHDDPIDTRLYNRTRFVPT